MSDGLSRRTLLRATVGAAVGVPLAMLIVHQRQSPPIAEPEIIPRDGWATSPPTGPLEVEDDVRFLLVHHTSGGGAATGRDGIAEYLRVVYDFHTGPDRGWNDVAYNFFVDYEGRIWEGRAGSIDEAIKGDATGGSQGFAVLSAFIGNHATDPPTQAAQDAMVDLLAWLSSRHELDVRPGAETSFISRGSSLWPQGSEVTTRTIAGHRDMSDTTCPGDAGYALVQNLQDLVTRRST